MTPILEVKSTFRIYQNFQEMPPGYQRLVEAAQSAALHAYAPYSNFKVGASVLIDDGTVVTGTNQENAAYPSGLCAERVAIFASASNHPEKVLKAIAVVANKENNWKSALPCGACRQVVREYETRQAGSIEIIMSYKDGKYIVASGAEDLLPLSFTKSDL